MSCNSALEEILTRLQIGASGNQALANLTNTIFQMKLGFIQKSLRLALIL